MFVVVFLLVLVFASKSEVCEKGEDGDEFELLSVSEEFCGSLILLFLVTLVQKVIMN